MIVNIRKYIFWGAIILIFICIVTIISLSTLSNIKQQTKASIKESLHTVLQTSQEAQHLWINYRMRETRELAADKAVVNGAKKLLAVENIDKSNADLIQLRDFIGPKLKRNNDRGFFIISPDNISIASMRNANLGSINLIDKNRPHYLERAFQGATVFVPPFHSDVSLSLAAAMTNTKEPTSFIITPIINANHEIIAVFAIRLDPASQFSRISRLGRLGESGETYAFDKNAVLITESRFDHHLRQSGKIAVGETGLLSIRITDPGPISSTSKASDNTKALPLTVMAKSAIAGNSGFNLEGYRDYRGVEVFGVWVWDKSLDIGMTTEIDVDEAMGPYFEARFSILLAVLLIALLSFTFILLIVILQKRSRDSLNKAYAGLEIRIEERTRELQNTTEFLNLANKELEKQAATDGLTQLFNRRKFDEHLAIFSNIAQRDNKTLSILMIDIDNFKYYNDNYGHQAGDSCIQKVAVAFEAAEITNRPGDIIARYGGEEFVIMLFDCTQAYAFAAAQKIHEKVRELNILHEGNPTEHGHIATVSIGICSEQTMSKTNAAEIVNKADAALYQAKENGRNCTCHYSHADPHQSDVKNH